MKSGLNWNKFLQLINDLSEFKYELLIMSCNFSAVKTNCTVKCVMLTYMLMDSAYDFSYDDSLRYLN